MKRFLIILSAVIVSLYLLFLLLPIVISPVFNAYRSQIADVIKDSTGFNVKLDKLALVSTPKLTIGVRVGDLEASLPTGDTFLVTKNLRFKVSLIPLLVGKIKADIVSVDNIKADLKLRQDGHLLLEEFLPKDDPDNKSSQVLNLPFGFKLSNSMPDVIINNYSISFINMLNSDNYLISGKAIKIKDFILNKKVKLVADGKFYVNDYQRLLFNISVLNKIMPDIDINDLLTAQADVDTPVNTENVNEFNILQILNAVKMTELSANINLNLCLSGVINSPVLTGKVLIDDITLKVLNKMLPESHLFITAKNNLIKIDSTLFVDSKEKIDLTAHCKKNNIDLHVLSNANIGKLFNLVNALAVPMGYKDLQSLSANGILDADFKLNVGKKKVKSSGYLKMPNANIVYGLYNLAIKNINADVTFDNKVNISNIGLEILGQPLNIKGSIEHNSQTDISVVANNIPVKGLLAALGQIQLLKENSFTSGLMSLNATIKGKFDNLVPQANVIISNVDFKNIPSATRIVLPKANFVLDTSDKSYSGSLFVNNMKILNPMVKITIPDTEILLGQKDIDIKRCYLVLNNSRIDIAGKISDYINNKLNINISATGNIIANDINSFLPKELRANAVGKLPLNILITGDTKSQNIDFTLRADSANYISILPISALSGHSTLVNSNIKFANDIMKLSSTGVYMDKITNPIITVDGSISDLSKSQNLNIKLSVPKLISTSIPGFKKSNMSLKGSMDILGTVANPFIKGSVNIPAIKIDDMFLTISDMLVNLNGPVAKGNVNIGKIISGGIVIDNTAADFILNNYDILHIRNILASSYNGKLTGNVSYVLSTGKITASIKGNNMNALKTIEGAAGIKNALSGVLNFTADITTSGASDVDIIKNLKGNATFNINGGKFLNVGRFDNLLGAQNLSANSILKATINTIINNSLIQSTSEFVSVNGNLSFNNGWANIHTIKSVGPLMAYYINGKYNMLNGTTNVVILGRIDEKIVNVLGPLGDLSVDTLTSYIPKFGPLTSSIIRTMTTDPKKENVSNIPALSSGSKNYKDFKVEFNGGIECKSSVKSFKWLSVCNTSAIDIKQNFNNTAIDIKNTLESTKQDLKDTHNILKNSVQDSKQQLLDTKDEIINLFRF